jgi:hypothetical protein
LARDHQISAAELAVVLKTEDFDFERHHLGKLMKEIHSEQIHRADRHYALAAFEETMTETVRVL